jgi:hypothetical protein
VARRQPPASSPLEVRLTCEPRSGRAACVGQAYARVRPRPRRPAPRACSGRQREDAQRTQHVGGSQQPCSQPREPSPPAWRRRSQPTHTRWPGRCPRGGSVSRPMVSPSRRPCRFWRKARAAPHWSARRGRAGALGWPRAAWTVSRSRRPSVWPGKRPTKSCGSMPAAGPGGRASACTARWARAPQRMCSCTGKAGARRMRAPRSAHATGVGSGMRPTSGPGMGCAARPRGTAR